MTWSHSHVPDQSGRTMLITGASGGTGPETARVLAVRRAHVAPARRGAGLTVPALVRRTRRDPAAVRPVTGVRT